MGTNVVVLFIDVALVFSTAGDIVPQTLAMLGSLQRLQRQVQTRKLDNNKSNIKPTDRLQLYLVESEATNVGKVGNHLPATAKQDVRISGLKALNRIVNGKLRTVGIKDWHRSTGNPFDHSHILDKKNATLTTISKSEYFAPQVSLRKLANSDSYGAIQHWVIGNSRAGFESLAEVETRVKDLLNEPIARKPAPNQRKGSLVWLAEAPTIDTLLKLVYNDFSVEWVLLIDRSDFSSKIENSNAISALVYTELSNTRVRLLELPNSKKLASRIKKSEILISEANDNNSTDALLLRTNHHSILKIQVVDSGESNWNRYAFEVYNK